MSDAQWVDVEADVSAAVTHFKNALALSKVGKFKDEGLEGYRDQMAFMHAMQCAHTSAEAALTRVLRILDEDLPTGEDWHLTLINRLSKPITGDHARPEMLNRELADDLQETRSFRHRVMHSYGPFDITRAEPTMAAAQRLVTSLPAAIARFRNIVDPPPNNNNDGEDGAGGGMSGGPK